MEAERGKGKARGAFRQIKIYDYTPGGWCKKIETVII